MKQSKIQWTQSTWNPWVGCSKVSAGCALCYAETLARRLGVEWGPGAARRRTKNWEAPRSWDRAAARAGQRRRVFPSLCDPFDPEVSPSWRQDFFALIRGTPNLDWLLLTKRPAEALKFYEEERLNWPAPNLWLGISAENQVNLELRLPWFLKIPARIRFISFEPILGPILPEVIPALAHPGTVDWAILGGESGPQARPCHLSWIRHLIKSLRELQIRTFVKQLGRHPVDGTLPLYLQDPKGGIPEEWPEDLQIREEPDL